MAVKLSLVAGEGAIAPFDRDDCAPAKAGVQTGGVDPFEHKSEALRASRLLPSQECKTLAEVFASSPRDGGWAGFLLSQLDRERPLLWVQERMAILEGGRVYPPGFAAQGTDFADFIHVEARDS
ncbi:MAG TPA: hypothetical protein VM900_15165, partial [Sphingomonas sp.]|nr:hypothetical protein [Sphingomonas sp.]